MSVGIAASAQSVNAAVAQFALDLRNTFQQIQNFESWLSASGGATFLQGIGFTSADAATIVSTVGNLDQLRQIYQGLANLATAFNYEANSNTTWGGN